MVDDSEFYQQLLVEFLETSNPGGLGKFVSTSAFFLAVRVYSPKDQAQYLL